MWPTQGRRSAVRTRRAWLDGDNLTECEKDRLVDNAWKAAGYWDYKKNVLKSIPSTYPSTEWQNYVIIPSRLKAASTTSSAESHLQPPCSILAMPSHTQTRSRSCSRSHSCHCSRLSSPSPR